MPQIRGPSSLVLIAVLVDQSPPTMLLVLLPVTLIPLS